MPYMSSLLLYAYVLAKTACDSKSREGFATPWPQTRSGSMHFPTMLTHAAGLPLGQIVGWLLNTGGPESKPAERVEHKVNTKCAKMTLTALFDVVELGVVPSPKITQKIQAVHAAPGERRRRACPPLHLIALLDTVSPLALDGSRE